MQTANSIPHPGAPLAAATLLRRYGALDGLRGVAAMVVAAIHLAPLHNLSVPFWNGALAVDFFFLLSGFVLAHAYEAKLDHNWSVGRFMTARIIRLWPMVALGMTLGAVASTEKAAVAQWATGVVLVPWFNYPVVDGMLYPLDPPAWSLLFELLASAAFGIGLWRRSSIAVGLVAFAGVGLAIALGHNGSINAGWAETTLHYGAVRVGFSFGAGLLLYRFRDRVDLPRIPVVVIAIILLLVLAAPVASPLYQFAAVVIVFPVILLCAAGCPDGAFARTCYWSGAISYPLYILHVPVYALFMAGASALEVDDGGFLIVALELIAAVAASVLALLYYDQPIRVLLTSLAASRARRPSRLTQTRRQPVG